MRLTPKRIVRGARRRLKKLYAKVLAQETTVRSETASEPVSTVVCERVVVRQLVLSEKETKGPEHISKLDCTSLLGRYALPPLKRMATEERKEMVDSLLAIERMRALGIDSQELEFPEANLKRIRNRVCISLHELHSDSRLSVSFDGTTASELNAFLRDNEGNDVHVTSHLLLLDETVEMPSDTTIDGHGVRVVEKAGRIEKAILLENVTDVRVSGFEFNNCCGYAVYVKNSERFTIENNHVISCAYKAICIMGNNTLFTVANNRIANTGDGSVFLNGDISHGIIEHNKIEDIGGSGNFSGGIVLSSLELMNIDTAYNPWQHWYMPELLESPHDLVIANNSMRGCAANGLYSHAGYRNYIVNNTFMNSNKEGMCLDFGTCGCYVAHNYVVGNGGRFGMSNKQLADEYVLQFGRLPDGSSPAKVPGISLDNAVYNIVYQNTVSENYGSGIKTVRSGARNVFLSNVVSDNNIGQNEVFHFFGIELGTDLRPDYEQDEVRELDFGPCYENILARNVISGEHYSGVFLGSDAYINDVFDNIVMDARNGIEVVSVRHNALVNNLIQTN